MAKPKPPSEGVLRLKLKKATKRQKGSPKNARRKAYRGQGR